MNVSCQQSELSSPRLPRRIEWRQWRAWWLCGRHNRWLWWAGAKSVNRLEGGLCGRHYKTSGEQGWAAAWLQCLARVLLAQCGDNPLPSPPTPPSPVFTITDHCTSSPLERFIVSSTMHIYTQPYEAAIPTLQMRKVRHREVKWIAQGCSW